MIVPIAAALVRTVSEGAMPFGGVSSGPAVAVGGTGIRGAGEGAPGEEEPEG